MPLEHTQRVQRGSYLGGARRGLDRGVAVLYVLLWAYQVSTKWWCTTSQLEFLVGHIQRSGRPISHTWNQPASPTKHRTPGRKEEVRNKGCFSIGLVQGAYARNRLVLYVRGAYVPAIAWFYMCAGRKCPQALIPNLCKTYVSSCSLEYVGSRLNARGADKPRSTVCVQCLF
jgi:hypothetical protein